MKYFLISLLFLSHIRLLAQNEKKMIISIFYQPGISGTIFKDPIPNSKPIYGHAIGLNFDYNFTSGFFIRTGLVFIEKGFSTSFTNEPPQGFFQTSSLSYVNKLSNYYVGVPVNLGFNFYKSNRLKLGLFTGLSFDFGVAERNQNSIETRDKLLKTHVKYNWNSYFSMQLVFFSVFNFHFNITKKVIIMIEPVFGISFLNIYKRYLGHDQDWNLGCRLGIGYNF